MHVHPHSHLNLIFPNAVVVVARTYAVVVGETAHTRCLRLFLFLIFFFLSIKL